MGFRHFSTTTREVYCVNIAGISSASPLPWWRYITIIGVQIGIREHCGLARINLILALEVNLWFRSSFLTSFVNGIELSDLCSLCALRLQHVEKISLVNSNLVTEVLDDFFEFHNSFQFAGVDSFFIAFRLWLFCGIGAGPYTCWLLHISFRRLSIAWVKLATLVYV